RHVRARQDHELVGRVDAQLPDRAGQLRREGDEPAGVGGRVLGEEQLAAADDALQAAHEPALSAAAVGGGRVHAEAGGEPGDVAAFGDDLLAGREGEL